MERMSLDVDSVDARIDLFELNIELSADRLESDTPVADLLLPLGSDPEVARAIELRVEQNSRRLADHGAVVDAALVEIKRDVQALKSSTGESVAQVGAGLSQQITSELQALRFVTSSLEAAYQARRSSMMTLIATRVGTVVLLVFLVSFWWWPTNMCCDWLICAIRGLMRF
ncbi:MAG: hypothetical protein IPK67_01755 [Planctomycetes bacterium]|nr:hypothetical protein [Planctomycetota bacterium]